MSEFIKNPGGVASLLKVKRADKPTSRQADKLVYFISNICIHIFEK